MELKIIDNFLSNGGINYIKNTMESPYFPWYYNDSLNYTGDKKFQFTHTFFDIEKGGVNSDYLNMFDECLTKLNASQLIRLKANLNIKTIFRGKTGFHTDYKDIKTAVLYVNTNNGGTKFKNGKFVKSITNRIVIFDSNLKHSGVNCNNESRRIVVNFNFI